MGLKKAALATLILLLLSCSAYSEDSTSQTKKYIVLFSEGTGKTIAENYGTIEYEFSTINAILINLTQEQAQALAQEPGIENIEEDQEIEIGPTASTIPIETGGKTTIMNEGMQTMSYVPGSQWNLGETGINAEKAWQNFNVNGQGVKIAIIDSGVNYDLPDLKGARYLGGHDYCVTGTGTNCKEEDDTPMDIYGHGTQMAAAMLGTGNTITGVASQVQYYALKIANGDNRSSTSILLKALDWVAAEGGADIIYMGVYTAGSTSDMNFIDSHYASGWLFVSPMYASPKAAFPAAYEQVIGVGAHSRYEPQIVMPETGDYARVVAPGEAVPVLALDGSVVNAADSVGVAAAQVAGALALMLDFNRTHNLGYNNIDVWKTLNYSAVDLWPGDSLAGWGKADVNSALTWMDQNWHIGYEISYLNQDTIEGDLPVYYFGSTVSYDLNIINNSNKDFTNLDVNSYHINLDGNFGKISGCPIESKRIPNLLANSLQVVGSYSWATTTETEPGEKGTEIRIEIGPITDEYGHTIIASGPTLTMLENGFILRPAPPGTFLHLIEMPSYSVEEPLNSSGAAVAKMILDYVRGAAGYLGLTQSEIYAYAAPGEEQDFNAEAMDAVLGHFDPYDENVVNYYDWYDSLYDGNPFQGYNYTIDYYDNIEDYVKDIVQWMAYPVTREQWWLHGELVKTANTPAALPIYGSYDHWVAVNGYAVSEDPTPDPYDPWTIKPFTVYGFWLTDPAQGGIGQHVYVTAAEATATYFLPMTGGTPYDGKFLQIAEPPAMPPEETAPMIMALSLRNGGQEEGIAMPLETSDNEQGLTGEPIVQIAKPVPNKKNLEIVKNAIQHSQQ